MQLLGSMGRALALGALVAVCLRPALAQQVGELTPSGDPAPVPAVRLIEAGRAAAPASRTFFGRVAARETVELSFEVGGRLVSFPVREGGTVPRGAELARLDLDPFERASERAALARDQAERDLERATRLAASDAASEVQAQNTRTQRDLADVELRDARAALADARLAAPFDAVVAERLAATFSNVTPGQPIVRLHDMSEVRVDIEVPERLLLQAGDPGAVRFSGILPGGGETPLELAEFEAQTGRVGQSFRVSLVIPAARAAGLIPGASMSVTASLGGAEAGGTVLPLSAIVPDEDGAFGVMVFHPDGPDGPDDAGDGEDGDGHVERRPVEVVARGGTTFEVEGLDPGTRIVEVGGHLLGDGARVRIYDGLTVEER